MSRNKRVVKSGNEHTALNIVRKFFPQVTKVDDADSPIVIEVTPSDNRSGKVKNHQACAMAIACKREMAADGVIVALTVAYVVKGGKATRYQLPESVAREVISFDRESKIGFAPGTYQMNIPKPSQKLGREYHRRPASESERGGRGGNGSGSQGGESKRGRFVHRTAGIRVLGSEVKR